MNEDHKHWLALTMVKGIGAVRFKTLLEKFGDAQTAWNATESQLSDAGIGPKILEHFLPLRETLDLDRLPLELEKKNITALTMEDANYPRRLKEIDQSPPILYMKGTLLPEDDWAVAVVGTRRVTPYGQQVAAELGAFLAHQGITVVSGLALGVDSIAQQSALNAGGRTIAVLAHGLDQVYPPKNRSLAKEIIASGALVSDYGLSVPPDSTNFPPRNRIISALSAAVVVVEAGERSGARITADFAVDQGKEVFAIPGSIYSPQSKGTNRLIAQGAHPLLKFEHLIEALDMELMTMHKSARTTLPEDGAEAAVYSMLSSQPLHVDEIAAKVEMPIDQLSSTLALMELKGLVRQVGGMNFVSVREERAAYTTENDQQSE
jgi:DNA processing protein